MRGKFSFFLGIFALSIFIGSSLFTISCRRLILESKLDPESKKFYSKVRYIISDEERKIFLELPPSEREEFIQEFWKRRDPTPDTEENEYRMEYLDNIETANKLFQGGGKPGYIQDRGRIYILLGPPDERYVIPVSRYSDIKSGEVWIYYKKQQMRLEFIDHNGDGEYTLERPSTYALYQINSAQQAIRSPERFKEALFDFNIEVRKEEGDKFYLIIEIPYKEIWFTERENRLETTLELSLKIFDSTGKEIWQFQKDDQISLNKEEIDSLTGENHQIKIPLDLEQGSYTARVFLDTKAGERQLKKEVRFSISE